eukprot:5557238-Prorocentrum_lima.AAC.1
MTSSLVGSEMCIRDRLRAIHRAAELTREWGGQIHVVKLDVQRAFDSLRHGAILDALRTDGLHPMWISAVA